MRGYLDYYLEKARPSADLPTLQELEKDYIEFLLVVTEHNITHMSMILDISRTAVYHKINKYRLSDWPVL